MAAPVYRGLWEPALQVVYSRGVTASAGGRSNLLPSKDGLGLSFLPPETLASIKTCGVFARADACSPGVWGQP